MADDEARRKALEAIAATADRVAVGHPDCPVGTFASGVAAEARRRAAGTSSGPAQVATPAYCSSWERTFGGKRATVGQA